MIDSRVLGIVADVDAERTKSIGDRWNLYDGRHPDTLRVEIGEPDDNTTLNNLAVVVDTGVDFLFGQGVEFAVAPRDEDAPGPDSDVDPVAEQQAYLDQLWRHNRKQTLLREWATSGAIAGDAYLKFVPAQDKAGTDHEIIELDPASVTMYWAPGNIRRIVAYRIMFNDQDPATGEVIVRREDHIQGESGAHWDIRRYVGKATGLSIGTDTRTQFRWEPDTTLGPEDRWPHAWPQVIHAKNLPSPHEVYGRPDLTDDLVRLNGTINRTAANLNKTLRLFAHPQPWAVGEDPTKLKRAINDAAIGAMMCFPAGTTLGTLELQAEGMTASGSFLDRLDDKFYELARVPRVAAGKVDGIGALSGVALLILYRPLIAKNQSKRDTYGEALAVLNQRILEYAGFGADLDVSCMWPDVLPRNEKEETETGMNLRDLGVSRQTILDRLGIDWDVEKQRLLEEASDPMSDDAGLLQRVEELEARGDTPAPAPAPESEEAA